MEILSNFVNDRLSLYILPVILVSVLAVSLYTFAIRRTEQPPFDKLISDDRKQAGKRKKIKEKKPTANGHVSTGESPVKESKRSPVKEVSEQKSNKDRKTENNKLAEKNKKNEALKNKVVEDGRNNKKTFKKIVSEKPVDFDDGDWEKVPSKGEKKKKPDQSPIKKQKRLKKVDGKPIEIEKLVKEEVNKELREKKKEIKEEKIIDGVKLEEEDPIVVIEEKKKEKKFKKENVEKPSIEESPTLKIKADKVTAVPNKEETSYVPAFDALGDIWEEPKTAKKSKKKARRDN